MIYILQEWNMWPTWDSSMPSALIKTELSCKQVAVPKRLK